MKKSFLTLLGIGGIILTSHADITVLKHNGGTAGYKTVAEQHSNGNSQLECRDPGNTACSFTVQPNPGNGTGIYYAQAAAYVESEVSHGNLSGSAQIGTCTVDWQGSNLYNYTFHLYK